jgi:hypothetical protein
MSCQLPGNERTLLRGTCFRLACGLEQLKRSGRTGLPGLALRDGKALLDEHWGKTYPKLVV